MSDNKVSHFETAFCSYHLPVEHFHVLREAYCDHCGLTLEGRKPLLLSEIAADKERNDRLKVEFKQPDLHNFHHTPEATDYLLQAKHIVCRAYNNELQKYIQGLRYGNHGGSRELETTPNLTSDMLYIVWFCKTLQNWKALLSSTLDDGIYYEVTHNGNENETYVDAYRKFRNITVDHNEERS